MRGLKIKDVEHEALTPTDDGTEIAVTSDESYSASTSGLLDILEVNRMAFTFFCPIIE